MRCAHGRIFDDVKQIQSAAFPTVEWEVLIMKTKSCISEVKFYAKKIEVHIYSFILLESLRGAHQIVVICCYMGMDFASNYEILLNIFFPSNRLLIGDHHPGAHKRSRRSYFIQIRILNSFFMIWWIQFFDALFGHGDHSTFEPPLRENFIMCFSDIHLYFDYVVQKEIHAWISCQDVCPVVERNFA